MKPYISDSQNSVLISRLIHFQISCVQAFYCDRDIMCETLPSGSYNTGRSYWQASIWCVRLRDCHMYICPFVWEACSQMYQTLKAGNVSPVRLRCLRDPIKKHTCSCCCVAHNYTVSYLFWDKQTHQQIMDQAVHLYLANLFARSGACCCTENIWAIWLLVGAIWGEVRRPSLTQNILTWKMKM